MKNSVRIFYFVNVYNINIKVLGFFMAAVIAAALGAIIGVNINRYIENDTLSDKNVHLNVSLQAKFKVHFEEENYQFIQNNLGDNISNIMSRKPITNVTVKLIDSSRNSEEIENDTAQTSSGSGQSKLISV